MSTLRKKVFSGAQVKCFFFFMAQITHILLFSSMLVLERSRTITVREGNLFKKKNFAISVFGICVSYVKRYFQEHQ